MINKYITFDYNKLGLKVGLEIHQQLNTDEKLHCHCKNEVKNIEDSIYEFSRFLNPKSDKDGNIDIAAIEQTISKKKYIYKAYDNNCLVELDEGDPFPINQDALNIALIISKLFNSTIVDVIHVMRKIIVDGSTTSGFQRTSYISGNGNIKVEHGNCNISSICLEEDSCTSINKDEHSSLYSLDRLGIPLIEIATDPDIKTPIQAYEVAKQIGMMLRSTNSVKRGIGTIRQDINISIKNGARNEIKGVQNLELIPKIIDMEIYRQLKLLELKEIFKRKNICVEEKIIDCTDLFINTKSKIIKKFISNCGIVSCIILKNGANTIGFEIQENRRFGTELADRAKNIGISGIFHTDELPNYGINEEEICNLRKYTNANENDAIIIICGTYDKVKKAFDSIINRIKQVNVGVPKETRRSLENGTTSYMRPLPGPSRMYPETDIKPIYLDNEKIKQLKTPELITDKIKRYIKTYNLNNEISDKIINSKYIDRFNSLLEKGKFTWNKEIITPMLIANVFINIFKDLKREHKNTDVIDDTFLYNLFTKISEQKISREIIKDLLIEKCNQKDLLLDDIIKKIINETDNIDKHSIEKEIIELIKDKKDFIYNKKEFSISPLMGILMKKYRGKIDGKIINDILKRNISKFLLDNN